MKQLNKIKSFFLIIFIVSFFTIFLQYIGYLDSYNLQFTDKLYGGNQPLDNIVIVKIDDKSINNIGRWPWNREIFANFIEKINNSKIIILDLGFFEKSNIGNDTIFINTIKKYKNKIILVVEYTDFKIKNNTIIGISANIPFEELKNYKNLGYANVNIDKDGVARSLNLNIIGNYSSISQKTYELYSGRKYIYNKNRFLVNFLEPNKFKSYSFLDVYNKKIDKNFFKNKIVFVGISAEDLHDKLFVPTSKGVLMDGVEFHANAFQTMALNNNLEKENNFYTFLTILFFAIITGFSLYYFRILYSSIFLFLIFFIYIFFAILIFEKNYILNLVYGPLTMLLSYMSIVIYSYLYEQKAKKKINDAFGKYVSPILIKEIMKNPKKLSLGGEKKDIIILFSDIVNFTSLSEKLSPEKLVNFLNDYLTYMTEIVLENNGVVDKFIGDAIMAFWGAPIDEKNKIELACKSAIQMIEKLDELKLEWKKEYDCDIDIRIGLNYGEAVIGNMGSKNRFDYTAIGDSVNLASRLEAINKFYKTRLMISQFVYEKIKNKSIVREIDLVRVKGKVKPIKIYELISLKKPSKIQMKFIDDFSKALNLYRNKRFDLAIKQFEKCVKQYEDKTSKVFIERCKLMKKEKLSKNWDGVFIMKNK